MVHCTKTSLLSLMVIFSAGPCPHPPPPPSTSRCMLPLVPLSHVSPLSDTVLRLVPNNSLQNQVL
ncbi:hypothetical protein GDO81_018361 [Engystomops pustulosus]|uniref:Secreted protein n=1 Tax=Engystomops pustulosus TaxID=76066 RepID=A0AAV7A6G5_ENGPU|nr:hypothetical protein GDO81_018361 [Engystomops pustulosus]